MAAAAKIPLHLDFSSRNNFDLLRFLAAQLVFFHHIIITSTGKYLYLSIGPINSYSIHAGHVGVGIFMLISGFLIAASWHKNPDANSFLWNRALRIFPALVIPVLGATFLLGPLLTTLSIENYFSQLITYIYLLNLLLVNVLNLPGVFSDLPNHFVNGSLWTLNIEAIMYILVAGMGIVCLLRKHLIFIMTMGIMYGYIEIDHECLYVLFFVIGMCAYYWRDALPVNKGWHLPLSFLCLVFSVHYSLSLLFVLSLAWLVFSFAFSPYLRLYHFAKYGDFSYGFYLYHYLILQLYLTYAGLHTPYPIEAVTCFLLTMLCAAFSWHMIEKRALRLKHNALRLLPSGN